MKKYDIVKVEFEEAHPNQWMEGYYALISKTKSNLSLCAITKEGLPTLFSDGSFMVNMCGAKNKHVKPTNLELRQSTDLVSRNVSYYIYEK